MSPGRAVLSCLLAFGTACGENTSRPADAGVSDAGAGRVPTSELCRRLTELDTVLAPSELAGSSEPVSIAVTSSGPWFAQSDALYRTRVGQTTAERVFQAPAGERVHGLAAREGGVVIMTESAFIALDEDGQSRTVSTFSRGAEIDLLSLWPVAFRGDRAVTLVQRDDVPRLLVVELASGTQRELGTFLDLPETLAFADADRVLWTVAADGLSTPHYARLLQMSLSTGETSERSVALGDYPVDFSLLDADESAAFVDVGLVPSREPGPASSLDLPGIYRVSLADGAAEKLVSDSALAFDIFGLFGAGARSESVRAGGDELLRVGSVSDSSIYRASPGAEVARVLCLELGEGWVERIAYSESALYLVVVNGSEVSIVRHAL